jgi:predicted RNase H-like nuclease (RuvC/YqgF family)
MKITKKNLIDLIHEINDNIDGLNKKLMKQESVIQNLKAQNESLKQSNHDTLDQIKEYIKELEQIRSHYVDSNNSTSR